MFPDDLCSYNSYYIYKRRWQVQREFPIFAMHLNSAELKLVCRRHRRTRAARAAKTIQEGVMQAKIADGVYLSQGNVRKLEQFSKGASQLAWAAGGWPVA